LSEDLFSASCPPPFSPIGDLLLYHLWPSLFIVRKLYWGKFCNWLSATKLHTLRPWTSFAVVH
jgi:hypothetical protein